MKNIWKKELLEFFISYKRRVRRHRRASQGEEESKGAGKHATLENGTQVPCKGLLKNLLRFTLHS